MDSFRLLHSMGSLSGAPLLTVQVRSAACRTPAGAVILNPVIKRSENNVRISASNNAMNKRAKGKYIRNIDQLLTWNIT